MHSLAFSENIVFLVLVAVVGLLRWISSTSENRKNEETAKRIRAQRPNAPPARAPVQTEEERVRKFMEALGVPTSNAPPPKVSPPPAAPKLARQFKRAVRPIDPFPRPNSGPWMPEPVVIETEPAVVISAPAPVPEPLLPTPVFQPAPTLRFAPAANLPGQTILAPADNSWSARLANSSSLRDAIILREIFGPPRSMQQIG